MKSFFVALLFSCYLINAFADSASLAPSPPKAPVPATSKSGKGGPADNSSTRQTCSSTDDIASVSPPPVIRKLGKGDTPYSPPYVLRLGEFVTVQVPHDKYAASFTKQDTSIQPTPVLYINGFAINGLTWLSSGCERFSFYLTRTEETREIWGKMLSRLDGRENIPVGIGTVQKGFIEDIGTARLVLTTTDRAAWWYLIIAVLIISTGWLGARTGLLRDLSKKTAPGNAEEPAIPANKRPFSLGRVQMAFWFVLSVGAFTYVWLQTGDIHNVIPDSILALMGISAGTTVLSAVVDTNATVQAPEPASGNFLKDILSDSDGISFHRLQMLVWTIVLGIIFVEKVAATLIMPDFDAQLLGLMGVASGTYLGFKIPASAPASAPAPAASSVPAVG